MHGKEFINDIIMTYFTLVTLITAVMLVLGTQFIPDAVFGYEAFSAPLIYAAYGTLPNLVLYARKELTVKALLIRKVIQFILIEAIVLTVALPGLGFHMEQIELIIALAISILVIYILSHLFIWFLNCLSAKQMTEKLIAFQQSHK